MAAEVATVLLAVLLSITSVRCQAGQFINPSCSEQNCTRTCFPDIWERDLCSFYSQLSEWASTARRCGLPIGPVAPWNRTLTASQQWEQARQSWMDIIDVWNTQAATGGLINQGLMDGFMSGSGSGSMAEMPTITMEPPQHSQSAWLSSMQDWGRGLTAWSMYESSLGNPTPPLPQPSSGEIIGRLSPEESAAAVLGNSDGWSALLADWKNISSAYTTTYQDTCPGTLQ